GEPALRIAIESRHDEPVVTVEGHDLARAGEFQSSQAHAATRIAQFGVAAALDLATAGEVETAAEAFQLCDEPVVGASDLGDRRTTDHGELAGFAPVHDQRFDGRPVIAPVEDVPFGDARRRQRALDIHAVHAEAFRLARL